MKILVNFMAYYWDNYQGGSGKYVEHTILVVIQDHRKVDEVWEEIHKEIKFILKAKRPFDQSIYSKEQKEYVIIKAEFL